MNKLTAFLLLAATVPAAAAPTPYPERPEAAELIERLEVEHDLDPAWVRGRLAEAEHQPKIIEAMRRPAEKTLAWHEYRAIFLDEQRINAGAAFVVKHAELFEHAEERFGVPATVIAGILGVETRYGKVTGGDRVLDALATLGFDYPERADFFRSELGEFLILAHEEDIDTDTVKGSYAGAMGMPQFIASSYRAYAVDFNDNGQRDLWDEPADVIGSVANYLAEHDWRRGEAIALATDADGSAADGLERSRRETKYRYRDLAEAGIEPDQPPADDAEVGLVELEGEDGPEFWVGLHNFFVITTYNHSRMYAMAVHQLGQAIAERLDRADEVAAQ